MDILIQDIFKMIGINDNSIIENTLILRDTLLDKNIYNDIIKKKQELKKYFSSSLLTSLQENADTKQKFPLINIIRQLLNVHSYTMKPVRKSNGYDKNGKKLYIRYFKLSKNKN